MKKYRITSLAMILGSIALVIALNAFVTVLNNKFPLQIDFTTNKMFELSDKTKEFLKDYDTPVDVYILSGESNQDERVSSALGGYSAAAPSIKVTNINMAENPTFGKKYVTDGTSLTANSVIVDSGERFKVYSLTELYGVNAQTGQYTSLNVENKMNAALRYVSSETDLKACIVAGHNEIGVDGARSKLKEENYEITDLNLLSEDIPEDASLVIIARPTADLSSGEISKLDAYLQGGGSLQCYFDADSRALNNLYTYLKSSWGIGVNDNSVIETDMSQSVSLGGTGVALVVPKIKETEFTGSILKNNRTVAYFPYSKQLTQEFESNGSVTVTPVLTSSESAYTTTNELVEKVGGEEEGEFIVGALSADTANGSSVYVSGNTMLLTLDASMLTNEYGLANYDYFMNLVNYTTGADDTFLVDEKTLINNAFTVSASQIVVIFVIVVILIPLIILVCGLAVWIKRRNL